MLDLDIDWVINALTEAVEEKNWSLVQEVIEYLEDLEAQSGLYKYDFEKDEEN